MCLFLRKCLFLSPVLIFEVLAKKMHSADAKIFFICWFSPVFNGKTGLCESEDLFFGLHRFLAEKRDSVDVKTFILLVFNDFLWFHNEKLLTFQSINQSQLLFLTASNYQLE